MMKSRKREIIVSLILGGGLLYILAYALPTNTIQVSDTLVRKTEQIKDYFRKGVDTTDQMGEDPLLNKLSKLEEKIDTKESDLALKLNELRNIELANLDSADVIHKMAANLTELKEAVDEQGRKFAERINELKNIDLETVDRLEALDPRVSQEKSDDLKSEPTNILNRNLLILVGSVHEIVGQVHLGESHSQAKMHRDLIFGSRGRNPSISDNQLFDVCPPGCEFTSDPARFNESDVVVFYAGSTAYKALKQDIYRAFPLQRFVYFFFEQPHNFLPADLSTINSRLGMNWTLHYQQDATVNWPYGTARRRATPFNLAPDYSSWKSRKVIWVVSRCDTPFAHREHYVAELIKYIDIDVYGRCIEGTPKRVPMDIKKIANAYKFFISFENGDCDDYITEKYFRYAKELMTVPIVLGRRNHYEQLVPANSYIQADQFDSPEQLAAYLHVLDSNPALYHKYFEWRKTVTLEEKPNPYCKMCQTFREKWFEPSQIDMHQYHGLQRCWKSNRNIPVTDWKKLVKNYTFVNPWETIKALNSKDKPLRFG